MMVDGETDPEIRQGLWDGFLISRTEKYVDAKLHRKQLKGREINVKRLPTEHQDDAKKAQKAECFPLESSQRPSGCSSGLLRPCRP